MRAGPLAIEDKSWHLNRMAIDSSYGCVVSAYAVLSDVRVVFLTQPDHRNTFIALPDGFERLQEEGRSSR